MPLLVFYFLLFSISFLYAFTYFDEIEYLAFAEIFLNACFQTFAATESFVAVRVPSPFYTLYSAGTSSVTFILLTMSKSLFCTLFLINSFSNQLFISGFTPVRILPDSIPIIIPITTPAIRSTGK